MERISVLTQKRLSHVESCRLNGDNSHRIIANLYSDSTHFLYELLQNAQDAEATSVSFELHDDRLETSHNGRAFSFSDVESITTIGSSTKSNEPNKIGKFGAGFKSVFSITNTPHIYSGSYNFKISDYIIPEMIDPFEGFKKELTTVILPFDKLDTDKFLYGSIKEKLKSIGKDEILFLSNLQRITWQIGELSGFVEKQLEEEENFRSIISIRNPSEMQYFELYVRNFVIDDKPLQTKIAFALDENGNYKSNGNSYPLFVFFPTVVQTYVQFLVHAPYKTTPNRETINFADSQNKEITDNIVELYKDMLIHMADRKRFDFDVMQLLIPFLSEPVSNNVEILLALFQAFIDLLKNHPLIPTREDGYALLSEVFYLSANLDSELFYTAQIQTLFAKSAWINEAFNQPTYSKCKEFVTKHLSLAEIKLNDIVHKLDESFLLKQSDEWIGRLYAEFPKAQAHVNGFLSTRSLARLDDGKQIPFKSQRGEIQVYLPSESESRFQCLSQDVCVLPEAKKFLTDIGITEPNVIDELKMFLLPSLTIKTIEKDDTEYYQALKNLITLYNTASETNQKEIVELLKKNPCLLSRKEGVLKLQLPKEIYLPTDSLKYWFMGNTTITMMDDKLWSLLNETELGASLPFQTRPVIQTMAPHIDSAHKERLRHTPLVVDRGGDDFSWDGLEHLLSTPIDKELSLIIWNFLITHLNEKRNILRGYYRWQSSTNNHEKEFDSKIGVLLKQTTWLYDHDGDAYKPTELKPDALMEEYGYDSLSVDVKEALALLSFKTDAIEELEKQGYKILSPDEAEAFEAFQKVQQQAIEEDDPIFWNPASPNIGTWVSEADPDMETQIEQPEFKTKKPRDLRNQTPQSFFEEEEEEHYRPFVPKAIRKHIGEWSERYVYRYLQDFCEEHKDKGYHVRWMNEEKNVGWGYDFVLMKGEKELRYIEVKGRASNTSEIEISKTQWEFAKFLFDKGEGDKYSIFIVQNAGKSYAKLIRINNPIKMWLDGNLSMLKIELAI